ncbi:hypothetical protein SAMN05877753_101620 [Bacillus oleivorans]|uniref:Uncharacterized protein n=1 Tax=Bacillus oleivorans TaxID=1448271 RepID=A0A285CI72_9BACI|nr:hypothetical protein SAMN05877753_101620 [Bacillus oleivorans]
MSRAQFFHQNGNNEHVELYLKIQTNPIQKKNDRMWLTNFFMQIGLIVHCPLVTLPFFVISIIID